MTVRVLTQESPHRSTREAFVERFWARVDKTEECWLWKSKILFGYGVTSTAFFGTRRAHRIAYMLTVGEIPDGLVLDHLCCVRNCVNPAHLEPVTPAENNHRTAQRRTHCKHGHELTPENSALRPEGTFRCRVCDRAKTARHYRKKRVSA